MLTSFSLRAFSMGKVLNSHLSSFLSFVSSSSCSDQASRGLSCSIRSALFYSCVVLLRLYLLRSLMLCSISSYADLVVSSDWLLLLLGPLLRLSSDCCLVQSAIIPRYLGLPRYLVAWSSVDSLLGSLLVDFDWLGSASVVWLCCCLLAWLFVG